MAFDLISSFISLQRDKARDKIESQDDWDTGGIVDFGEGILEAIMGDEDSGVEKPKTIREEDIDEEEYMDEFEEVLVESPVIEPEIDLIAIKSISGSITGLSTNTSSNSSIYSSSSISSSLIVLGFSTPLSSSPIIASKIPSPKSTIPPVSQSSWLSILSLALSLCKEIKLEIRSKAKMTGILEVL